MNRIIVESSGGITLVAGGPVLRRDAAAAVRRAPMVVAADGGADRALALGLNPVAVVGDLDSIGAARHLLADRLHPVSEQETTDFHKTLSALAAPFVLALGVLGGRVDHELAALSTLIGPTPMPVIAIGREDVVFAAPPSLDLRLRAGDRLSLYPLAPVTGESRGLDWPIKGLDFRPEGRIGTSNRVGEGPVSLRFSGSGMLVILPRARLEAALDALSPGWRDGLSQPSALGG